MTTVVTSGGGELIATTTTTTQGTTRTGLRSISTCSSEKELEGLWGSESATQEQVTQQEQTSAVPPATTTGVYMNDVMFLILTHLTLLSLQDVRI